MSIPTITYRKPAPLPPPAATSPNVVDNLLNYNSLRSYLHMQYDIPLEEIDKLGEKSADRVLQESGYTSGQISKMPSGDKLKAALRIQLGSGLGLTPSEVNTVLNISSLPTAQLDNLTRQIVLEEQGIDPTGLSSSTQNQLVKKIESLKSKSYSHVDTLSSSSISQGAAPPIIVIAPPSAKTSAVGYIQAITAAMKAVMLTRDKTHIADGQSSMRMLRETIVQTQLKIQFSEAQNVRMVDLITRSIAAMLFMRVIMYLTLSIVTLIMVIISIVLAVVTFGASVGPSAVALALLISAIVSAIATLSATIVTIMANEYKRTGKFNGADGKSLSDSLYAAALALEVISLAAALAAAVAGIAKVILRVVGKVIEEAVKLAFKQAAREIIQIVLRLVADIAGSFGKIMQMRGLTNRVKFDSHAAAERDYNNSTQYQQVQETTRQRLDALDVQFASQQINSSTYAIQRERITQDAQVQDAANLAKMSKTYLENANKAEETANWIVMALSIAFSLGAAVAGSGVGGIALNAAGKTADEVGKKATKLVSKTIEQLIAESALLSVITRVLGFVNMLVNLLSSIMQGVYQLKINQAQLDFINSSLNDRQMIVILEAVTVMWNAIESDIEKTMKQAQESFKNIIAALTSAMGSTGKAMEKLMRAF